jgi:hypothetical protein
MNNIKSKNKNTLMQDIHIHNFIFALSSYFQYNLQFDINKKKYKINTAAHLNIIINNILFLLFYKKATKKNINEILRFLNISKETLILIRPNRFHKRIRMKPTSKWCQYGNKYKMNKGY